MNVTNTMRLLPLLIWPLMCACSSGHAQEPAPFTELTLHGDMIAKQVETSLQGTQCELHADKVDEDGTRHPRSFVQLGPSLSDKRFDFSVPDYVTDLGYAGQITYRVSDIRLKTIEMAAVANEFVISASFVSHGVALKGEHSTLGDAVIPGIKLDDMHLAIHLKPIVTQDGKITYDEPRVEFTADVDNTFIPRFTVLGHTVDVVDSLTHYRREFCSAIQKQIKKALDDPARKAALADKIQQGIAGQFGGSSNAILGLRFQGTDLVVKLRR